MGQFNNQKSYDVINISIVRKFCDKYIGYKPKAIELIDFLRYMNTKHEDRESGNYFISIRGYEIGINPDSGPLVGIITVRTDTGLQSVDLRYRSEKQIRDWIGHHGSVGARYSAFTQE